MPNALRHVAAVMLVDRSGALLLQLRDEHADYHPNVWGLPPIVFVPAAEILDGRPFTPGTEKVLARSLASPEYARLAGGDPPA